ncbi:hypothetical protein X557_01455 [Francisella tularensis subsp. holarctica PHIT-FT049]|uniref:hypothetical protein n=1 Tax=Francisella tularensis TaxID=263 RepID=UPI0003E76D6A|nr:hypothetical protein X557_01455 [Francisella tularensis subsp. holarctica PHIT-FT049]ALK94456.1 hypothetical protein ADP75_07510 [Francisella tularensis]
MYPEGGYNFKPSVYHGGIITHDEAEKDSEIAFAFSNLPNNVYYAVEVHSNKEPEGRISFERGTIVRCAFDKDGKQVEIK